MKMTKEVVDKRRKNIMKKIQVKGSVNVEELASELNVTPLTIRRDLQYWEDMGAIERFYGGAKLVQNFVENDVDPNEAYKHAIAKYAATFVEDGDTIFINTSSTALLVIKYIIGKKITIYTTNTDVFSINENVIADIFVLGGRYNPITSSLTGPFTEDLLKNLYFNKSFLGANGIDETLGVTTPTIEEATKKRMVKRHSDQIYLVCDSSKFHELSNVKAFDLDDVIVISDKNDTKLNEKVSIITEL